MGQQAVIVYESDNDHWVCDFLHEKVKHAYLCYAEKGMWVTVNYTVDGLRVGISKDLPKGVYYQRVVIDKNSLFPVFPTCVGMIKNAVGIRNPFILTPWQLLKSIYYGQESKEAKENSRRGRKRASTG